MPKKTEKIQKYENEEKLSEMVVWMSLSVVSRRHVKETRLQKTNFDPPNRHKRNHNFGANKGLATTVL